MKLLFSEYNPKTGSEGAKATTSASQTVESELFYNDELTKRLRINWWDTFLRIERYQCNTRRDISIT